MCARAHSNVGNSRPSGNGSEVPELLVGSTESRIGDSDRLEDLSIHQECVTTRKALPMTRIYLKAHQSTQEQSKTTGCPILTVGNM